MIAGAGGQVTTFKGNGEEGSTDGAGATVICIELRNLDQPRNLALVPHLNDPASHQRGRLLVLEKGNKGLLRDVDALLWAKENLAVCLMYPSVHLCVYVCASLHEQQFLAHAGIHSDVHTTHNRAPYAYICIRTFDT